MPLSRCGIVRHDRHKLLPRLDHAIDGVECELLHRAGDQGCNVFEAPLALLGLLQLLVQRLTLGLGIGRLLQAIALELLLRL
jgi:hypothetical protein